MTSAVESVIKMINRRVKGSEKFWSEPGAEAILQLRADYLSETETMSRFWTRGDENQQRPHLPCRVVNNCYSNHVVRPKIPRLATGSPHT